MKSILVIGLGRFGKHLSRKLIELGNDVMIVDAEEENLRELMPLAANAQVGDCTQEAVLRTLGVNNFDLCFVCMASNFQSTLEITSLLKDLGAKYVISTTSGETYEKFLLRNGADRVIDPDRDIAVKLAVRYSSNNLYDYFEITKDVSLYEIPPLAEWFGKSIREINFRVKYHVSIIATKVGDEVSPLPMADHVFKQNEHLIVLGKHADVEKLLVKTGKNVAL